MRVAHDFCNLYYRLQKSCATLIKKKLELLLVAAFAWTFLVAAFVANAATFVLQLVAMQQLFCMCLHACKNLFAWVCIYVTNAATRKVHANAAISKSSCFFFDEGGAWFLQSVIIIEDQMVHDFCHLYYHHLRKTCNAHFYACFGCSWKHANCWIFKEKSVVAILHEQKKRSLHKKHNLFHCARCQPPLTTCQCEIDSSVSSRIS